MFYVSSVSGELIPFDPGVSRAISTTPLITGSAQVNPVSVVTETPSTSEVQSSIQSSSTSATMTTSAETQDAAVYEGQTVPTSRERGASIDTLNTGRAGAVMAYRVQEAEFAVPTAITSALRSAQAVQPGDKINDDAGLSRERVNPVRKSNYRQPTQPRDRKKVVVAADIMSAPVFSLRADLPVEHAKRFFQDHKFRHVPILSELGRLVGIMSDRDFFNTAFQNSPHQTLIKDRMAVNILSAQPQTPIRTIAEVMIDHHVGCLPILDQAGALVGIITRTDILRAIVNHAPIELWT